VNIYGRTLEEDFSLRPTIERRGISTQALGRSRDAAAISSDKIAILFLNKEFRNYPILMLLKPFPVYLEYQQHKVLVKIIRWLFVAYHLNIILSRLKELNSLQPEVPIWGFRLILTLLHQV
jgi:hypothetical protein